MRLECTLLPRKTGNILASLDGVRYDFKPDDNGTLTAEVSDEEHVRQLLKTGNFIPADESDFEVAAIIAGSQDEAYPDDDDDVLPDESAPPIEANTPPAPRRGRKRKAQ